jgi:hypothetical protein
VDIQTALEDLLRSRAGTTLLGIISPNPHESPPVAQILAGGHFPIDAGPLQHDEIDIGEAVPVRCLKNALWLSRDEDLPFAILMAPGGRFGLRTGVQVEIAVAAGERGAQFSQELFRELELLVSQGRTYRGRIISLEGNIDPMGGGSMVKVHRLAKVNRDDVILPQKTLAMLDRNVAGFMARAAAQSTALSGAEGTVVLRASGYGQDLHDSLPCFATAKPYDLAGDGRAGPVARRMLSPGTISAALDDGHRGCGPDRARARACTDRARILLNKLLNEMDGLREDAEVCSS